VDLKILAREIKDAEWEDLISSSGASEALKLSVHEIYTRLLESCGTQGKPILSNCWFDIYWTASWVNALLAARVAPAATVLEVGAGLSSNFIRAASSLLGSRGRYVAVNLNRRLGDSFKRRNRQLPIRTRFIEGNARDIQQTLSADSCAFIAFNHQINDIVQTIVFEGSGHKTDDADWYSMVPEMVRLIVQAQESGEMQRTLAPQFLEIIRSCAKVLHRGGVMGFNNAVTPLLLRHGYSEDLLGSFVPLARRWIGEGIESLQEESFAGFDSQWWLFFRRV
jgi:hypothetical protein